MSLPGCALQSELVAATGGQILLADSQREKEEILETGIKPSLANRLE